MHVDETAQKVSSYIKKQLSSGILHIFAKNID